jgi:RimJ/RimL family protein N-acetyltransferase
VEEEDAGFIVELRTDPNLSRFLSPTNPNIEEQKAWIAKYKLREEQGEEYYFLCLNEDGEKLGLNRLYNFEKDCFEIGSWLYKPGLPMSMAVLGDLTIRDYGFENLGFDQCKFEVRKANLSVVKYHLAFKPEKVGESELDYYFRLSYDRYKIHRDKLLKILNHG